jgi:hypothetical protein
MLGHLPNLYNTPLMLPYVQQQTHGFTSTDVPGNINRHLSSTTANGILEFSIYMLNHLKMNSISC